MRYPSTQNGTLNEPNGRIGPGGRFGHLHIRRELGRGSFSTVYLAQDTFLGRAVALKVLGVSAAPEARDEKPRLLREIRLVGRLASPHIVHLYSVHDLGGAGAALEMEYLDGGTLADIARNRRLPLPLAMRIVRGIVSALDVAHRRNVIHRDVKPGNVLLGCDGSVKLGDFGLGRQVGEAGLSGSDDGCILGTPLYMSPEVVMAEPATFASDLWSAGVLLYRLLMGHIPFDASSHSSLFDAIRNDDPRPLDPALPAALHRLVGRCLEKDPERRPGSAREMLDVIDCIQRDDTGSAVAV